MSGESVGDDPFDPSIDASWLGATPTAEDAFGNPVVETTDPPAPEGAAEAGA
jgi:hypothetical protein